jgi:hypothetical protein
MDTPKRGVGQPRKHDAKATISFRAHSSTVAAKEADGRTWEALARKALGLV